MTCCFNFITVFIIIHHIAIQLCIFFCNNLFYAARKFKSFRRFFRFCIFLYPEPVFFFFFNRLVIFIFLSVPESEFLFWLYLFVVGGFNIHYFLRFLSVSSSRDSTSSPSSASISFINSFGVPAVLLTRLHEL